MNILNIQSDTIVVQTLSYKETRVFPLRPKADISQRLTLDEFLAECVGKKVTVKEQKTTLGYVLLVRIGNKVYYGMGTFTKNWMKNILFALSDTGKIKLFKKVKVK